MNKFNAKKITIDGKTFDSKKEASRYSELKLLEKAGQISDLDTQVTFCLIPKQTDENGRVIERACTYKADFVYTENGKRVVEDVKGFKHSNAYQLFAIKRKLMLLNHGIRIREV